MDAKLLEELIGETTIEDIGDRYSEIVKLIGIRNFVFTRRVHAQ